MWLLEQRTTRAQFLHDVDTRRGAVHIIQPDNTRVIQALQNSNLILQMLPVLPLKFLYVHNFCCTPLLARLYYQSGAILKSDHFESQPCPVYVSIQSRNTHLLDTHIHLCKRAFADALAEGVVIIELPLLVLLPTLTPADRGIHSANNMCVARCLQCCCLTLDM